MEECSICQDNIVQNQNVVTLGRCSHKFHALCIQTWATIRNTCPLCRETFTEAHEINRVLPTLLAMAIIMPMEDQIQRIYLAFAFIKLVLQFYPTSTDFNTYKALIITVSEQLIIDNYRLPLLCYTNRWDLSMQCNYLKNRFRGLTGNNGAGLERHPFVRAWKNRLLTHPLYSRFFYEKTLPQQHLMYYPQSQ